VKGERQSRVREARGSGYRVERVGRGGEEGLAGERTGLGNCPSRRTEAYWRRRVPAHWEVPSNFSLFQERVERGGDETEMLTVTIDRGILRQSDFLGASSKKDSSNEDKSKYKRVKVGDIAYNKMRMWQGAVGFSAYEGIVSPAYIVLEPRRQINPRYYHYLFRTPLYTHLSAQHSHGICDDQNSLRFEDFKRIFSPLPPRPEQDAIVAYLDRKLEAVDRYLQVKEREIALLEERKRALIHRAVTRGLDPDPKLKPSGIPWLPEIPVGWGELPIRRIIKRIDQGVSPQTVEGEVEGEHWGVLKSGCTNDGAFREVESKRLPPRFPIDPGIVVQEGDVLVSRASGSAKHVGSVARVGALSRKLILSDKNFRLVLSDPDLSGFVVIAMMSYYFRQQLELVISGAEGLPNNLPVSQLKALRIAMPPDSEARRIERETKAETDQITSTITRARLQIERMQEYRTALIAETVTGKLGITPAA